MLIPSTRSFDGSSLPRTRPRRNSIAARTSHAPPPSGQPLPLRLSFLLPPTEISTRWLPNPPCRHQICLFSNRELDFSALEVEFYYPEVDFYCLEVDFDAMELDFQIVEVNLQTVEVDFDMLEVDFQT